MKEIECIIKKSGQDAKGRGHVIRIAIVPEANWDSRVSHSARFLSDN